MKNTVLGLGLFSKNSVFLNKLIACLVFFCIIMSSANIVNNFSEPIVIDDTIQISAQSIFVQFFYISALPANLISKIFLSRQADPISNETQSEQQNKNKAASNSSKASVGYSILPAQADLTNSLQQNKSKLNSNLSLFVNSLTSVKSYGLNSSGGMPDCISGKLNSKIIKMLLLAIVLTRRNIGEGNIFTINIKNKNRLNLLS